MNKKDKGWVSKAWEKSQEMENETDNTINPLLDNNNPTGNPYNIMKKEENKIKKAIDDSLKEGWEMSKRIHSGGFFSRPTYDRRKVYNRKDLFKLNSEGFSLNEDHGNLALNILMKL